MNDAEEIAALLSAYINERDNAKKESPFYVSGDMGRMPLYKFSEMIDGYHMRVFSHLPPMNLAQMEAFAELANSRLNWMRMQHR